MAYRFEFDSANRILRCRFEGQVNDESLKNFYRLAGEYVASLDPLIGITDFSAVTSFKVSVKTIRQLAWSEPVMPQQSRPRFIVAVSSHIFGMARMFEFEGEATRPNMHVVRSLDDVWAILGIEEPHFEQVSPVHDGSEADPNA